MNNSSLLIKMVIVNSGTKNQYLEKKVTKVINQETSQRIKT